MARLYTSGFEWNDATADAITLNAATYSSANPRTGSFALNRGFVGGSPTQVAFTGALSTTYFGRCYYSVNDVTLSTTNHPQLASFLIGVSSAAFVVVNIDGSLTLSAGGGVGTLATTAAGVIPSAGYVMIELSINIGTGSVDAVEARVNGVSLGAFTGLNISDTAPSAFATTFASAAAGQTIDMDDVALNDSTGAAQNSWPGSGKVVLLKPVSDSAVGTGWTLGTGTAISANSGSTAVKNTPPLGVADLTAGSDTKQIRNATSNANVNYDANLTTYTTAGIGASDTVNVLVPMVATGAPVVTSAKAGTFGVSTNPAIANVSLGAGGTAGAFWSGVAAGTYPTGWKWSFGTTTYAPTVTRGSSPVARITQVTSSTRIADVCAMGMYVDYTPAVVAVTTPPKPNVVLQAVNRSAVW